MSIQGSMDSFKRTALKQIITNITAPINSSYLISKLADYIRYGSDNIFSLTNFHSPDTTFLYSADVSAKMVLGYLELYTQYIINAGNTSTILGLSKVSLAKYMYVIQRYMLLDTNFKEKEMLREYKYVRHINFATPNEVYTDNTSGSIYGLAGKLQLSYDKILSLPLLRSKTLYADDLQAYINDNTIANIYFTSDNKNIFSTINRKYGNSIGAVKAQNLITDEDITKQELIKFEGLLNGFISLVLFFKVVDVVYSSNQLQSVRYATSIDGVDWDYTSDHLSSILLGERNVIYAFGDVDTGLAFYVNTSEELTLEKDMIWGIVLDYDNLGNPICSVKMVFNTINPISYIIFNDISEYALTIATGAMVKDEELSLSYRPVDIFQNSLQSIIPVNNNIYSVDISFEQDKYRLNCDTDSNLQLKYNYDIADIVAYSNIYYKTGAIMLKPLTVSNITTAAIEYTGIIAPIVEPEELPRCHIMFSIVTETLFGISEIPIINSSYYIDNTNMIINNGEKNNYYFQEPFIIDNRLMSKDEAQIFDYTLKFNFEYSDPYNTKLFKFNPYFAYVMNSTEWTDKEIVYLEQDFYDKISLDASADIGAHYVLQSNLKIGTMEDTNTLSLSASGHKWKVMNNRVAFMQYLDHDGKTKLALRIKPVDSNGTLYPFSGKIYGKIYMMSSESNYISPYLTSYTLSCI